jgi:hypothetical protein
METKAKLGAKAIGRKELENHGGYLEANSRFLAGQYTLFHSHLKIRT